MDEILRIAGNLKLYLAVQNSYFKDDEFDKSPIEPYLKPYYISSLYNQSQYYYMLVSENLVNLNDNPVYGPPI
jgi:hypothetical protein